MSIEEGPTNDLTPASLGLPEKFKEFRPHQLDALVDIASSDKKVILLQGPTGVGKTLLVAALGKYLRSKVLYTCHTKQLQSQVVTDFPYAIELKGRANYSCLKGKFTCQECTKERGNEKRRVCKACEYNCSARPPAGPVSICPCVYACPYLSQKAMAKRAELAVLNTSFFLTEANYVGDFSGWKWVVLDEGDLSENALMSFIEVSITATQIEKLKLTPPRAKTVAEAWLEWADEVAVPAIQSRLSHLQNSVTVNGLREKTNLERLLRKLLFLVKQNLDYWVFIPTESSWSFKPVFVSRYAKKYLWDHADRFLVMSATIISPHQFARDLGLAENQVDFIDLPSDFPPERRPVFFIPSADMTHKNKETAWPEVVRALDEILEAHPNEKGLVHTVSYPLARYVAENSAHKARLVQHDSAHRISALEDFKVDSRPLVLLSPSMDRGVDLPEDLCRFVVLLKVPYPYLGDVQISRRLYSAKDGPLWYAVQTIRTIVQATGRGMRSEDDYCVSYILDEQFGRLYREYTGMFPRWWRDALTPCPPFLQKECLGSRRHRG